MPDSLPLVSAEVREALATGGPVLALESTLFTHGVPRPRNLEVAGEVERRVREAGVVPATIGVVGGNPVVGLSEAEINRLCIADGVVKAGVRDLPVLAARELDAGTTVAATSLLAHATGVRVFATGGIGGVHHGAATSFDESADLVALSSTPLIVVSAGVKSVLDIAATLERLETLSIAVLGYRSRRFPGFYVADSGHELDYSVETPEEVAAVAEARDELGLRSAVLVANPVPVDEQLDPELHQRVLREAWQAAEERGVVGHDVTPFLLDRIQRSTGGRSLDANIAAYRNNVAVGCDIARAVARRS